MAVSGDVTIAQDDGQENVKLHPYLITLLRWCVSRLWSAATVLLHRLMTTPLQPITGPKTSTVTKPKIPCRAAGTAHLHPEPKVECQLLHQPLNHSLDVIFVHGLYGSLGNTWRQGEWRQKYISDPQKVPLINHSTPNTCNCHENSFKHIHNENKCDDTSITDLNDPDMSMTRINEKLSKKVIPQENELITEQFYNNTLQNQVEIVDNYETQAKFVSDLFKKENGVRDKDCDENNKYGLNEKHNENNDNGFKCDYNFDNDFKYKYDRNDNDLIRDNNKTDINFKCKYNENDNDFKCDYNEINDYNECKCNHEKKCEVGCGCICNDCYSLCWPKDWIKIDFPEARVISINYTSDPYLWRPLWIKENKRLNLYQRAEQMIEQLLEMGVGEKPIIWVGHSKGGLFIKQIYCEAYEAFLKTDKSTQKDQVKNTPSENKKEKPSGYQNNGITAANIDTIIGHFAHYTEEPNNKHTVKKYNNLSNYDIYANINDKYAKNCDRYTINESYAGINNNYARNYLLNNSSVMNETVKNVNIFEQNSAKYGNANNNNLDYVNFNKDGSKCDINVNDWRAECGERSEEVDLENGNHVVTSSIEESVRLSKRASLWSSSRGFMFYSVPHRGSPLADIKTPVTARSVDLLEIAKDCPLVLELQERWLQAAQCAGAPRVSVRSFVETCRTLMSVLWLRIVTTHSADAGIGTLSGIPVDHREICKPSSRTCLLYTELTGLIHEALNCKCQ